MKNIALQDFPFVSLTVAALVLFLIVFVGVTLWAYRPGSGRTYEHIEKFPLE
jgi:cbb3-type cytochrome oxidase subunit 3